MSYIARMLRRQAGIYGRILRHDVTYPELPSNTESRKGRNIKEGEWRGIGLEIKRMDEVVASDPLYREACAVSERRSIVSERKRMNLYLILKFFLPKLPHGHIVEFGSYRGGMALFMAYVAKKLYPKTKVFALDTFQGIPETNLSVDWHRQTDFADADLPGMISIAQRNNLDNLVPVQGLFERTFPNVLAEIKDEGFRLAHIDCDIHSGVSYAYDAVKNTMVNGGYIVFDDPLSSTCIGAMEAVENLLYHRDKLYAEQMYPHPVYRMYQHTRKADKTSVKDS